MVGFSGLWESDDDKRCAMEIFLLSSATEPGTAVSEGQGWITVLGHQTWIMFDG